MELENKSKYLGVLSDLLDIEKETSIATDKTSALKEAVSKAQLVIPVVGEFSAGKSTLLNKFMNKGTVLSVAMTPETAIAAELYYSTDEHTEAVRTDGSVVTITDEKINPKEYLCVKKYINSENLKSIEPIVLVDMPGFDSPLDEHNQAIFNYLDRGCNYAVITPANAGTISASMKRQIDNIVSYNKSCTFFVSKTDLRSDEELQEVIEELQDQIEDITGKRVPVYPLNHKNIDVFSHFISSLDPESLFKELCLTQVKDECFEVKDALSVKLSALKKTVQENDYALEELQNAKQKLIKKKEKLIEEVSKDNYETEGQSVANSVGNSISSSVGELVEVAISGGQKAVENRLNDIIQSELLKNINSIISDISRKVGNKLATEIRSLDSVLGDYGLNNVTQSLADGASQLFNQGFASLQKYLTTVSTSSKSSILATLAGTVSIATGLVGPIIGAVLIALPTILNTFFKQYQEDKQKQEIRKNILDSVPEIKRKVKEEVISVLKGKSDEMIKSITESFEEKLASCEAQIENAKKKFANKEEIENEIQLISTDLDKTNKLLEDLID